MTSLKDIIKKTTNATLDKVIRSISYGNNPTGQYSIALCSGLNDPKLVANLSHEEKLNRQHSDNCVGFFIIGKGGQRKTCDACYRTISLNGDFLKLSDNDSVASKRKTAKKQ